MWIGFITFTTCIVGLSFYGMWFLHQKSLYRKGHSLPLINAPTWISYAFLTLLFPSLYLVMHESVFTFIGGIVVAQAILYNLFSCKWYKNELAEFQDLPSLIEKWRQEDRRKLD